uniref:NADH-ubiquinone oxidoreductase chain 6 n=1 Tax=Periacma orthiodes TaxID=2843490 RepID=A0A8F0LFR2_9NEOP|nr:NADH dehydrogenase subunit 6 [Periacma orthiodes]
MKMFLSFMLMLISIFMFFLNHPLSMGLMILIQTLFTCLLTGMLMKTYWFSYILFLTFLGGLLVLFIYVSSIASNEMFKISYLMYMYMYMMILIILFLSLFFLFNLKWMNFSLTSEMNNFFNSFLFFNNENKINLSKLYNNHTFLLMMMMIIYLFITLVAVVKITNIFYGPLRPSF